MKYTMTSPCDQCPFLDTPQMRNGFSLRRLMEFASGQFPCHKTAKLDADDLDVGYEATEDSLHCAGALIFLEKREAPNQMMRICERLGSYDMRKLNMEAPVR